MDKLVLEAVHVTPDDDDDNDESNFTYGVEMAGEETTPAM